MRLRPTGSWLLDAPARIPPRPHCAGDRPPEGVPPARVRTPLGSRSARRPSVHLQSGSQLFGGAVDAGLGACGAYAQHVADLLQGEVEIEVEKEREAVLARKLSELAVDVEAFGGDLALFGFALDVWHADHRPPVAAALAAALVGDDGAEPGARRLAFVELVQLAPGFEGGLLDGVVGGVGIAEDSQRGAVSRVEVRADEGVEVRPIGLPATHRQLLHSTPRC